MGTKISILIRFHSGRERLLKRALDSIFNSGYPTENLAIVIHASNSRDYEYLTSTYEQENIFFVINKFNQKVSKCFYNLYCNILKDIIQDGWFFYLDSDDYLIPNSLIEISKHLTDEDEAVICQFKRGSNPKPSNDLMDEGVIINGKIGMPCLFLNAKHKNIASFTDDCNADYLFIREVADKLKTKFVKIAVVQADRRSHGK